MLKQKLKVKGEKSTGFTLIEALISIAILGLIASVAVNIFSSAVQSYNKANILNELQQNGNHAISVMEQKIRNAEEIINYETMTGTCPKGNVCAGVSWLVIETKAEEHKCIEFGLEVPSDSSKNSYIYRENSVDDADCEDGDPRNGHPSSGGLEITNANKDDPKRGINVSAFAFTVDTTVDPATVKIEMTLMQGKGTSTRPQYQAELDLKTTVSLRSYQ